MSNEMSTPVKGTPVKGTPVKGTPVQGTPVTATPVMGRDTRIDWLRGLALVMIFINHMPGNRFENWTNRNFGFSDAAEVFVLLAGVAAAFAYFRKFAAGDVGPTTGKIMRRVGTLYAAHVASTLAAVLLFAAAALWYANPDVLDLIGIAPLWSDPVPGLIGIATGGYQLGFFNILPLYVLLLAALPAMMWLARRDLRLLLAVSVTLYLAASMLGWSLPNYPTDGGWYFNPFLWQLLFAIGLTLGILKSRGAWVPYHRGVWWLAVAYLVFAAVWMQWSLGGYLSHGLLPGWMDTLHKSYLPMPRLFHVLALAYVLVHSPLWDLLRVVAARDRVLVTLGQNSLPAFVTGSLASMVGYILLVHAGSDLALEVSLILAGVAAMWIVAKTSEIGLLVVLRSALVWTLYGGRPPLSSTDEDAVTSRPTSRRG
jgi:hypothetical protein